MMVLLEQQNRGLVTPFCETFTKKGKGLSAFSVEY